jgi:hypothetical protein
MVLVKGIGEGLLGTRKGPGGQKQQEEVYAMIARLRKFHPMGVEDTNLPADPSLWPDPYSLPLLAAIEILDGGWPSPPPEEVIVAATMLGWRYGGDGRFYPP